MTKRKWDGRREGFRVNTTREETQGPGRPTSRGRFSESWKRLSSRQGSTKRSGLAAQQAARQNIHTYPAAVRVSWTICLTS
ncbi:transient receptor potential cation channel subfamily M member 3 isoform X1 [Tachysurus ichikawai]